ncbi:hypothetical protein HPB47_025345 [Ixodes persulcatus]|uniref:Uncharacterized protein n=1 Tax=Ixodes persulcatus TaxID=34615 RepID=A0AC60Q3L5_IXOPE|nr:hypothetical protein HPB47_025345 [Ixodes persulcatus]
MFTQRYFPERAQRYTSLLRWRALARASSPRVRHDVTARGGTIADNKERLCGAVVGDRHQVGDGQEGGSKESDSRRHGGIVFASPLCWAQIHAEHRYLLPAPFGAPPLHLTL